MPNRHHALLYVCHMSTKLQYTANIQQMQFVLHEHHVSDKLKCHTLNFERIALKLKITTITLCNSCITASCCELLERKSIVKNSAVSER